MPRTGRPRVRKWFARMSPEGQWLDFSNDEWSLCVLIRQRGGYLARVVATPVRTRGKRR